MFNYSTEKTTAYIARDGSSHSASDGMFTVFDNVSNLGGGIKKHILKYKNNGNAAEIIPVFESVSRSAPEFYMIPTVNYNGNEWGTCKEPKGMEKDGEPWIFPSDRIGIPACSIAEFPDKTVGLFSDNCGISANSSASIFTCGESTVQRIYFSHIEYPTVYAMKYIYDPPIIEFIPFESGETKEFVFYTYEREKHGEKFGYGGILDFVSSADYVKPLKAKFDADSVAEYCMDFIRSLITKADFGYIANIGFLPGGVHDNTDKNSAYEFRRSDKYEIGWCGQNITIAEMLLRSYAESGNENDLMLGLGILDTWIDRRTHKNGIISVRYDEEFSDTERIDSCNAGWLLWKLVLCCEILDNCGICSEKHQKAARGVAEYYMCRFPDGGFPQISNAAGEVVNPDGCAGTMLTLGFLHAYRYFGDERYLSRGKDAFDFYYGTYLANSIAAGGALDTYCIDKESAGPVLRSALMLYDITGDRAYIDKAENTAYYLMTWTYYHDVPFPDDSDCTRLGVRTTGGTSVSTAHHHLDVWGVYYVPEMVRLAELTGNTAFLEQAKILWLFTLQYMSDGELTLHGLKRGKGAENEAVLHCNWNWSENGKKGELNDWLVAWVTTFKLDVYHALRGTGFFESLN